VGNLWVARELTLLMYHYIRLSSAEIPIWRSINGTVDIARCCIDIVRYVEEAKHNEIYSRLRMGGNQQGYFAICDSKAMPNI
jgi:hypothetical protein